MDTVKAIVKAIKENPGTSVGIALIIVILASFLFCGGGCGGKTDDPKSSTPLSASDLKKDEYVAGLKSGDYFRKKWEASEEELRRVLDETPAKIKEGVLKQLPEAEKKLREANAVERESLREEKRVFTVSIKALEKSQDELEKMLKTFQKEQDALERDRKVFDAQKEVYWKEVERLKTGVPIPAPDPRVEERKKTEPDAAPKTKVKGPKKDYPPKK